MLGRFFAVFALLTVAAQAAASSPPACMIAAVNTQSTPSNIEGVCSGSNASSVAEYICQNCGGNIEAAFSAFSTVCSGAGVTFSNTSCLANTTSTTSSSTGTSSGSASSTAKSTSGTGTTPGASGTEASATATKSSTGSSATSTSSSSSSASASSSSSSSSTSSASVAARLGMDIVGMVVLGMFGAMLAL